MTQQFTKSLVVWEIIKNKLHEAKFNSLMN